MIKPNLPLPFLLAAWLCCLPAAALAHEGHHEAEPETAAPLAAPAPHTALDTAQIELVAQREGADIVLYLDDYASNAPLNGLQVSVRSGTLTLQAAANGEGAYRIAGDLIDAHTEQALDISVHGAGIDAQLHTVLPPAVPADHAEHAASAGHDGRWIVAAVPAVLTLFGLGWLLRRRRGGRAAQGFGAA